MESSSSWAYDIINTDYKILKRCVFAENAPGPNCRFRRVLRDRIETLDWYAMRKHDSCHMRMRTWLIWKTLAFSLPHKMLPPWAASSNECVFDKNDAAFSIVLVRTVDEIASGRMRFSNYRLWWTGVPKSFFRSFRETGPSALDSNAVSAWEIFKCTLTGLQHWLAIMTHGMQLSTAWWNKSCSNYFYTYVHCRHFTAIRIDF